MTFKQYVFLCFSSPFRIPGCPQCSSPLLARRFLCSACKCMCTSIQPKKIRLAGDTDVDVGTRMAVGTFAACNTFDHAPTCHSSSDSLVLAANEPVFSISTALTTLHLSFEFGLARARGQQHCLQHNGGLLSTKRNSDGPRFHTRNEGSGEFSASCVGSTPERPGPVGR